VACSTPSTGNNLAPRGAPAFSDSHDDTRDLFDNSKHPYVHVSSLDDVDAVYGSRTADRDWDVCGGRGKGDGEVLRGVGVLGRSDDVDEASEPGIDAAARECLCGNGTEVEYFFAVMACIRGEDGGSKERELSGWEMCSLEEAIGWSRSFFCFLNSSCISVVLCIVIPACYLSLLRPHPRPLICEKVATTQREYSSPITPNVYSQTDANCIIPQRRLEVPGASILRHCAHGNEIF